MKYSLYERLASWFSCFKVDNTFLEISENLRNERLRILETVAISRNVPHEDSSVTINE
jgi:hypothetical protein